jgi:hypothetical protein
LVYFKSTMTAGRGESRAARGKHNDNYNGLGDVAQRRGSERKLWPGDALRGHHNA